MHSTFCRHDKAFIIQNNEQHTFRAELKKLKHKYVTGLPPLWPRRGGYDDDTDNGQTFLLTPGGMTRRSIQDRVRGESSLFQCNNGHIHLK